MNKKLLLVSILAVLTLVAISFATVVSSNTTTTVKKKESPLFGIRTRLAIGERVQDLKDTIKARFIGGRVFFLPFQWLRNKDDLSVRQRLEDKTQDVYCTQYGEWTCQQTICTPILCTISDDTLCGGMETCEATNCHPCTSDYTDCYPCPD